MARTVRPGIFALRPHRSSVLFWSRSMISTCSPLRARRVPIAAQVVDFPTPPFEDANETIILKPGQELRTPQLSKSTIAEKYKCANFYIAYFFSLINYSVLTYRFAQTCNNAIVHLLQNTCCTIPQTCNCANQQYYKVSFVQKRKHTSSSLYNCTRPQLCD